MLQMGVATNVTNECSYKSSHCTCLDSVFRGTFTLRAYKCMGIPFVSWSSYVTLVTMRSDKRMINMNSRRAGNKTRHM